MALDKKIISVRALSGILVLAGSFLPLLSEAGTRSVFFTQSARNQTVDGINDAMSSHCLISLSNPSPTSQIYTLKASVSASGTEGAGPATFTDCTDGTVCTATGSGTFTCSATLAASSSASCTFTYPQYRSRTSVTAAYQVIVCSGSIVATDVGDAGFLVANGSMDSFTEAGARKAIGTGGPTTYHTGTAHVQQVSIDINNGKPF